MDGSSFTAERIAPLSGLAFVVLGVVGVFLVNGGTEYAGAPAELARHYTDGRSVITLGAWLGMLAGISLVWFGAVLWRSLRLAEGPGGRLSVAAFGGSLATGAVLLVAFTAHLAGALRAGQAGGLAPDAAATLFDVSGLLWGVAAPFAMAVTVGATGAIALRHRAFPAWWGWTSLGLGVLLLILPVAWIAFIAAHAWVAVVALWMLAQAGPVSADP